MQKLTIKSTFLLLSLVLSLGLSLPARADVLTPGYTKVYACFKIDNLNKYPQYLFIAVVRSVNRNPTLPYSHRILKPNLCFGDRGYRMYSQVYALPKSAVKPGEILAEQLKKFDEKDRRLIPSKLQIEHSRSVAAIFVGDITDVLEIVSISNNNLELREKSSNSQMFILGLLVLSSLVVTAIVIFRWRKLPK
ncbi:hypothetical protein QUB75_07145 [Microcoleus sp. K1-B6]|uniref:hypothetical protein n=1 Tax=unclassified Microcoleus TaxID=2642155 RepID=UPI002FD724A5